MRSIHDKELPAALSEPQFRLTILIGAVLSALPVVAKITSDQFNIELGSGERDYAQRICDERADTLANNADVKAIEQRVASLEAQLAKLAPSDPVESSGTTPKHNTETLLGDSVVVFHRARGADTARQIEAILQLKGAGVALRETDLTQSSLLKTALL